MGCYANYDHNSCIIIVFDNKTDKILYFSILLINEFNLNVIDFNNLWRKNYDIVNDIFMTFIYLFGINVVD